MSNKRWFFMNGKIFSILALFLLVLGTMVVSGAEDVTEEATTFSFLDAGVTPMAIGCNYVCSKCIKYGLSGACTSGGSCC